MHELLIPCLAIFGASVFVAFFAYRSGYNRAKGHMKPLFERHNTALADSMEKDRNKRCEDLEWAVRWALLFIEQHETGRSYAPGVDRVMVDAAKANVVCALREVLDD